MQLPGVGAFRTVTQFTPTVRENTSLRDRVAFTAVPAVAATVCAVLLLSLEPGLLVLTSAVIALVGFSLTLRDRRSPADTVILVGRSPMASIIASSIEEHRGNRPVVVLRADHMGEAANLARLHRCDEVVLVGQGTATPIALTDSRGTHPSIIPGAEKLEQLLNRIPLEFAVEDRWLNRLQGVRPLDTSYAIIKRTIDATAAAVIALVMLPILPLVALAIKLDSPGPIFYSQQRVGLNGRTFRIYKFRTMRQDAEANGAVWASQRDPRITRTGNFMRKTRLDEIPQLWNLIRGDMALVGPRPERPEFTATLAEQIPAYDLRHTVKPGLTGWAQVCYRYTSSIRDTRSKVEYDLYYVKHCSLLLDLRIMVRTVKVVLAMKGQ
jgi:exopolysaccharide biosynthesis polyprenyl glycosylphosphotransferase